MGLILSLPLHPPVICMMHEHVHELEVLVRNGAVTVLCLSSRYLENNSQKKVCRVDRIGMHNAFVDGVVLRKDFSPKW